MGNYIAIDCDEENFRLAVNMLEKPLDYDNFIENMALQRKNFNFPNSSIHILEFSYNEIHLKHKEFEEFLLILQKYYNQTLTSQNTHIIIRVSGYHADYFIKTMEKYVKTLKLGCSFQKEKQIPATICGLHVRLNTTKHENFIYYFKNNISLLEIHKVGIASNLEKAYYSKEELVYPYFLVNIKGGLSFYLVEAIDKFKRLGGSIIGETTLINLIKLMTKHQSVLQAFESAFQGDNRKVDITVGDIYGDSLKSVLSSDIIASSLGKSHLLRKNINEDGSPDILKSVFIMAAINIAQLSALYSQIERVQRLVVVTNLLRNELFFAMIQSALSFFLSSEIGSKIYFVEDVEFLSSIGRFFLNK